MASAHSEAAKMEQIVTEFYTKTLQIIAESRSACVSSRNFSGGLSSPSSTSLSSSSSVRPRDKWFNLALRECPTALESSDLLCRGYHEPMFVDVVLVHSSPESKREKILERWVVHHETGVTKKDSPLTNRTRSSSNSNLYKKTILLLRSLYVTVRLLPAYKIYHGLNSSSRISSFTIVHRVSSFSEPFSRREEAEMEIFTFTPVETPTGQLSLSVSYKPSLSGIACSESSTPLASRVITDYVGSPLADPLKRFSSSSFTRRHSWSFDVYSTSSPLPDSFSPSPTHSEQHQKLVERPCLDKKDPSLDECFPSLIFALSPSSPIQIPGTHLTNSLLRSESAPVRVTAPRLTYNSSNDINTSFPGFKQELPPSSTVKTLRTCTSAKLDKSTGVSQIDSPNKLCRVRKVDDKQCSEQRLSSNSSPQVSISRGSSLSIPGDFEESDCACPFDVDSDDITDPCSRPESFEQRGANDPIRLLSTTKSRDAAVGELVLLLRKAQPLHQDLSKSAFSKPDTAAMKKLDKHVVAGPGLVVPKTTAEALEELQGYRDLKNVLVARGSKSTQV